MTRRNRQSNRPRTTASVRTSTKPAPAALSNQQWLFIFICTALAVSIFLHFSSDEFADPDDFYHFRHAAIYGSAGIGGLFRADFPWVHYSVISKYSADLWYGFHLLIIPFTWLEQPFLGMRVTGVYLTSIFLVLIYVSCLYLRVRTAVFWPFFLLFSSAFLLHRLCMLRPQVLSLGLSILLFALLSREKVWGVLLAGLALTFVHLNLFFITFVIFFIFALVKYAVERKILWRELLVLAAGILSGWLLRPNPLGAAQILYVQLFQFTSEKLAGTPLDRGTEFLPLNFRINSNYLLFSTVLLFTLMYFFWRSFKNQREVAQSERSVFLASGLLTIVFFVISISFARRAFDFCSGFGVIFISLVFSRYLIENRTARLLLVCIFVFLVVYGFTLRNRVLSVGWNPHRFESTAKWISDNSSPGEIVFNARWEYFPELFFWNTRNIYSAGMDPIFQYAYDPVLYWKSDYLRTGKMPNDCGDDRCRNDKSNDPYQILKDDFHARYVVLAKPFDRSLYFRLWADSRFLLRHENNAAAVFQIN